MSNFSCMAIDNLKRMRLQGASALTTTFLAILLFPSTAQSDSIRIPCTYESKKSERLDNNFKRWSAKYDAFMQTMGSMTAEERKSNECQIFQQFVDIVSSKLEAHQEHLTCLKYHPDDWGAVRNWFEKSRDQVRESIDTTTDVYEQLLSLAMQEKSCRIRLP